MFTRIPRRFSPLAPAAAVPRFRPSVGLGWALSLSFGLLFSATPLAWAQPAATQPAASPVPAVAPAPAAPAAAPMGAPAAAPAPAAAKKAAPPAKPATPAGKATATGTATATPGPTGAGAATPTAAERPPLVRVVDSVQKVYENTSNLKARFAQTLESAMGKRQASGVLRLKKPGKMRWDYEKPEKKLFVTDGAMLWMYEPEDEQAFRQPLQSSQLPAQVSFLFGKGRLSDEFDITYLDGAKVGQAGDLVLKLVPKKATAQYKHLVFVVDPKTFMVKETVLYDQQGGTNHIVFSGIETNLKTDIDDSRFAFTPPPNTKIINPR